MKQVFLKITENVSLARSIYRMTLSGDTSGIKAGQFINVKLDGYYLRRPISVCDVNSDSLTLIYKVAGKGTEEMSGCPAGKTLDVLTCLGNGYDLDAAGENALIVGGGVGIPPLYLTAKSLLNRTKTVTAVLGFNTKDEAFLIEDFQRLGVRVLVTTVDGSLGIKGFVTDAFDRLGAYDHFYACGPEPMLKAVYNATTTNGQFSLEERMGCGFGACMGCSIKTATGYKRVCKDGPVFYKEEILW